MNGARRKRGLGGLFAIQNGRVRGGEVGWEYFHRVMLKDLWILQRGNQVHSCDI